MGVGPSMGVCVGAGPGAPLPWPSGYSHSGLSSLGAGGGGMSGVSSPGGGGAHHHYPQVRAGVGQRGENFTTHRWRGEGGGGGVVIILWWGVF